MLLPRRDDLRQDATRMLAPRSTYQTPYRRAGLGMASLVAEPQTYQLRVDGWLEGRTAGTTRYWVRASSAEQGPLPIPGLGSSSHCRRPTWSHVSRSAAALP